MSRKNNYWQRRETEALKHYVKDEKEYDKQINRIYSNMLDACQSEINAFYGKYASKEGVSIADAKKRVTKLDIASYERKAKKYVEDAARDRKLNGGKTDYSGYYFSTKANEEMALYNLTMKVNRLEMLKANIGLELVKGHAELESFMGEILEGRTLAELERQAGILGKTVLNNAQKAHAIVNASFNNATFSDRIWMYQDMMKADLSKMLQSGMIQGKNPRVLAREMRRYFKGDERLKNGKSGAIYNTERLMRTELARVQTEAQKQSFQRNGFDYYEFIVNGGCCPICEALSGKHFKVSEMMPGENAPPVHCFCRCSTAAWVDDKEYEAWLDYLDTGGTTVSWDEMKKGAIEKNTTKNSNKTLEKSGKSNKIKVEAPPLIVNDKQFGKKLGRHAKDFDIDPSTKGGRDKFLEIINDIKNNATETCEGYWRGQPENVLFFIKGKDVVITKKNGEFITVMKEGVSNERVKNARNGKIQ